MAITRAQQYKQMLQNGGRIGFRVGTGEGKDTSGRDYGGNVGSRDRGMGMSGKTGFSASIPLVKTTFPSLFKERRSIS